ncbi:MAG: hypothetical protein P1V97_16875 [Planctomycetota bacterium]|nr:hypothetical protein [Planctomycetota bacterium]
MSLGRNGILALLVGASLMFANTAYAQGTTTPPAGGSTASSGANQNLDLPEEGPANGEITEENVPTPPPEEPDPEEEPPTFYGEPIPTENATIFYVVDTSCSMGWDRRSYVDDEGNSRTGYRIDRAKSELRKAIRSLPRNFKFNMLGYGCSIQRFRNGMVDADAGNKNSGIAWVNGLRPSGGTMTGPATAQGLADKQNKSVILLTDGAPNCGASSYSGHKSVIASNNTQNAIVTVFGIGASGSLRTFCQDVARDNGGNYVDVP